ncbi:MAG: glyoxalase/bleomycin resistance protein/dioxygenase superfamily protein [Chloroflexi bacterium]|nr:glyoxalase/bleomycin resistance protein/dioxygenase superfamily protein [Chloroflexota bacterium]
MFKRIDHVEIVTDQPERTVEFFTEVLGFKVRSRDRIDGSPLGVPMSLVYLDLGGTTVELISYEGKSTTCRRRSSTCERRGSRSSGGRKFGRSTPERRFAIPTATTSS